MGDDKGNRRRRRPRGKKEWYDRDADREDDLFSPNFGPTKQPIILAKSRRPVSRDSPSLSSDDLAASPKSELLESSDVSSLTDSSPAKTMTVLKSMSRQGDGESYVTSPQSIPAMLAGDSHPTVYQVQQRGRPILQKNENEDRLNMVPSMNHCVKLVDDSLVWSDSCSELLLDQTDFLVVGVLGMQGVGKSTVMSHLAGTACNSPSRAMIFPEQSRATREVCGHETTGVDLFISSERTLFLDTQPILSPSVLDQLIHHDIKYPVEYTSTENCIEMQSLQLAAFLMTVCNVIVVVMEGFSDVNIFRFLQTAEMLKPATPQSADASVEDSIEIYPHIGNCPPPGVFVVNQAEREDFTANSYEAMQDVVSRLMQQSNLKFKGPCNMLNGHLIPGLNGHATNSDVSLFLLPSKQCDGRPNGCQGHVGFKVTMESLTRQILSIPRHLLTHTTLSEKNWFHYAARTWEGVKKSGLMSEYNRLLL